VRTIIPKVCNNNTVIPVIRPMDNFGVADLVSALEEEEEEVRGIVEGLSHGYDEDDPATTSTPHHPKTFPLKTSKQRSSNRKAKTAAAAAAASNPGKV